MSVSRAASEQRIRDNRIRRNKELRHHFVMCLLTFALIISFASIFFSLRIKAQEQNEEIYYKYYKSVVVEEGDTLWQYAKMYGNTPNYNSPDDYIKEVIRINSLAKDSITTGQYLILPYYSSEFVS